MDASGRRAVDGTSRETLPVTFLICIIKYRTKATVTKRKYFFMLGNGHTGVYIIFQSFLF